MKIVHICQFLGVGGLEKVLLSLVKEQLSMGHKVKILVYDHDKRWAQLFRTCGAIVVDDFQKRPGYDLKLLGWIRKNTADADLVHTHDLNPVLYAGIARLIQKATFRRPMKLVHTTHGMEHLDTHPKTKYYELLTGLSSSRLVGVSPKFVSHYRKQFLTNKKKVKLVENGTEVEPNLLRQVDSNKRNEIAAMYGLNPTRPIGIYVGRISPMKAQMELIKAYNESGRQLVLVGPATDEEYFLHCARVAKANIAITGARNDIRELLKACDYFISSSLHEGMPIATLEAGATGLPCVLSNIPGHRQFNSKNNCVYIYENPQHLETILQKIETEAGNESLNFYKLIHSKYSSRAMALRYQRIYEELTC